MKTLNVLIHILLILGCVLVLVGMAHQSDFSMAVGFLLGGTGLFCYLVHVLKSDSCRDTDCVDVS